MKREANRRGSTPAVSCPRARSLLLAAALLGGCEATVRAREALTPPPIQVVSESVRALPLPLHLTLTGSLRGLREADVAVEASGVVARTAVERGDRVRKGAPLVVLDGRTAGLAMAEADAFTASAEAERSQAERECARAELLAAAGALARVEHERLTSQCSVSRSASDVAKARAQSARRNLDDMVVRAPFSGSVVERLVSVGEYVAPPRALVRLVEDSHLRLELSVPESEVGAAQRAAALRFRVAAHPERWFEARVTRRAPVLRPDTRDLILEADVANPDGALRAGMFAVAELAVGTTTLPVVARPALRELAGAITVFVVSDGMLEERLVRTGPQAGERVGVVAGLAVGERIVTELTPFVRDGARVQ